VCHERNSWYYIEIVIRHGHGSTAKAETGQRTGRESGSRRAVGIVDERSLRQHEAPAERADGLYLDLLNSRAGEVELLADIVAGPIVPVAHSKDLARRRESRDSRRGVEDGF
jgi:hypothetical protein